MDLFVQNTKDEKFIIEYFSTQIYFYFHFNKDLNKENLLIGCDSIIGNNFFKNYYFIGNQIFNIDNKIVSFENLSDEDQSKIIEYRSQNILDIDESNVLYQQFLFNITTYKNMFIKDSLEFNIEKILNIHYQKIFSYFTYLTDNEESVNEEEYLFICKYIYSNYKEKLLIDTEIFYTTCVNGNIKIAKWLYSINGTKFDVNHNPDINYFPNSEHIITLCAEYNYLEMTKWLLSIGAIVNNSNIAGMIMASGMNHFEMVKLLYYNGSNLSYIDDKEGHYSAFFHACKNASQFSDQKDSSHETSYWKLINWILSVYEPTITELRKIIHIIKYDSDIEKDYSKNKLYKFILKIIKQKTS